MVASAGLSIEKKMKNRKQYNRYLQLRQRIRNAKPAQDDNLASGKGCRECALSKPDCL
jgi:hypothetical protein